MKVEWSLLITPVCKSWYTHSAPVGAHRHSSGCITIVLLLTGSYSIINHKSPEAVWSSLHLHGVYWGAVGCYPHGRCIKSQLPNGAGLAVRFMIVSDLWKNNSYEVFPEIRLWRRSPHQHRPQRLWCLSSLILPSSQWQADADGFGGGDLSIMAMLQPKLSLPQPNFDNISNSTVKVINIKVPASQF
jgi:hypothetical protein